MPVPCLSRGFTVIYAVYLFGMKRITTDVPPPLADDIERFKQENGYETRAQAVRALIRGGLQNA